MSLALAVQELSFVKQNYMDYSAADMADALNDTFHGGKPVRSQGSVTKLSRFGIPRKMAPEWTAQVTVWTCKRTRAYIYT